MSSILTNTSSMVALQTLKGINNAMNKTQQEISTGKSIASAKDNSAIWAISKVMESDVSGFKAISDSLSLGESSVAVARNASESITDLLTNIKAKVVASQEENVDRSKIQTDIGKLRDQISSIVDAAQFNGLNLLKGSDDVDVLSSLDRAANGTVTARQITVERQNLEQNTRVMGTGTDLTAASSPATSLATSKSADINVTATSGNVGFKLGGETFSVAFATDAATTATAIETAIQAKIDDGTLSGISLSTTGGAVTVTSTNADEFELDITGGATEHYQVEKDDYADLKVTASTGNVTFSIGDEDFSVAYNTSAAQTAADIKTAIAAKITSEDLPDTLSLKVTGDTIRITNGGTKAEKLDLGIGATVTNATELKAIEGTTETLTFDKTAELSKLDSYQVDLGGTKYTYVADKGDTFENVAKGLAASVNEDSATKGVTAAAAQDANGNWTVALTNTTSSAITMGVAQKEDGVLDGGLLALSEIDVSTAEGATSALADIEGLIQTSIDAAASFGSAQSRIETQSNFISKLTDSLKGGIGTMVDADMEETSARLQALQVQQQLGVQSLSIANQSPQSILSLFR